MEAPHVKVAWRELLHEYTDFMAERNKLLNTVNIDSRDELLRPFRPKSVEEMVAEGAAKVSAAEQH